jgi:hypothetical protein
MAATDDDVQHQCFACHKNIICTVKVNFGRNALKEATFLQHFQPLFCEEMNNRIHVLGSGYVHSDGNVKGFGSQSLYSDYLSNLGIHSLLVLQQQKRKEVGVTIMKYGTELPKNLRPEQVKFILSKLKEKLILIHKIGMLCITHV